MNTTTQPVPVATPSQQSLLSAWLNALVTVVRDKGVLLLLVGAPGSAAPIFRSGRGAD